MSLSKCASVRLAAVTQSALECSLRRTHRELGRSSPRRIRPTNEVFVGRGLWIGTAFVASPWRNRPTNTHFGGCSLTNWDTANVNCMDSEDRIPRPIASPRCNEGCRNLKATSNAPSVSQEIEVYIWWTLRTLPYHLHADDDGIYIQRTWRIWQFCGEFTLKCKYCVFIYSNT